jgi:hypothetical protein
MAFRDDGDILPAAGRSPRGRIEWGSVGGPYGMPHALVLAARVAGLARYGSRGLGKSRYPRQKCKCHGSKVRAMPPGWPSVARAADSVIGHRPSGRAF